MKQMLLSFTLSCVFTTLFLFGCGPCREELEIKKAADKLVRYKSGDVVYLKPDSCLAVVTSTTASYNYNTGTAFVEYWVRDCHGLNVRIVEEFIYGRK